MKYLRLFAPFLALLLFSCHPLSLNTLDSGALRTQTGDEYHWAPGSFPLPVAIHADMDPQLASAVMIAMQAWNAAVGEDVFYVHDAPSTWPMWSENGEFPYRGYIAVQEGIAGTDPAFHVQRNAFSAIHMKSGVAGLRGEIHSVHILMGSHMTELSDQVRVAVHELGHALGLQHDGNDPTSILWYSATQSPFQRIQMEDIFYVRAQVHTQGVMEISFESPYFNF